MFKGNMLFANKHANNEKMWPPAAQSLDNFIPCSILQVSTSKSVGPDSRASRGQ